VVRIVCRNARIPISQAADSAKLVIAYFFRQGCAAIIRDPAVRLPAVAHAAGALQKLDGRETKNFAVDGNKVAALVVTLGLVLGAMGIV